MKNTLFSRIVASALLVSTLLLTACASDSGDAADTSVKDTSAETTTAAETEVHDNVPDLDFEGYEFRFLTSKTTSTYCVTVIEEQTGEVLNDAMYERTNTVADRFNIKFAPDKIDSDSSVALTTMRNFINAGDDAYDVCMQLGRKAFVMTSEGLFVDLNEVPYIEFDQPWYFNDINDQVNLSDANYLMFGSLNLGIYDMMNVILFNKTMLDSYSMEDPYELVQNGTWVFDTVAEMARKATVDTDGDGAMTDKDQYGFAGRPNSLMPNFLAGSRLRTVEFGKDGIPALITDNEKIFTVFDRVMNLFRDDGIWYTQTVTANDYYVTNPFFENGQALFADRSLFSISKLRDMDDDFGIVPFPKYDEKQEEYGAMIEAGGRVTVVPVTAKKLDAIGAVLEALNFYSWRDVVPAYYEVALKQKYSRDEISSQMFDLVLDSIYYDLGMTMLCETVKDGIYVPLFRNNERTLASKIETQLPKVNDVIDKAMNAGK